MSNNAKSELSTKVQNLLRLYMVQDRQSKAHYEHQNPIERRVQDVKHMTSTTINRTGCLAKFWLLCLLYVVALLNVLVNSKGAIPLAAVTGQVVDMFPFLSYHFWQEVFYEESCGSVITSSTIPHSRLSKRWNALSYHCVREAIASGIIRFHFVPTHQNPSDVLTKPLDTVTAWPFVEVLLFWKGNTMPKVP